MFYITLIVVIAVAVLVIVRRGKRIEHEGIVHRDALPVAPEPATRRETAAWTNDNNVTWTRELTVPERYRIEYADRHGEFSDREITVTKLGERYGTRYIGALDEGKFKTFRADRVMKVQQLSTGHSQSIFAIPSYHARLPDWPVTPSVHKVPTISGNRHWTVDLSKYSCTCPEKRVRASFGYQPGQLGAICPHLARAIVEHLPANTDWDHAVLAALADDTFVNVGALI